MSWASDDFPWWFYVLVVILGLWKYIVAAVVGGGIVWALIALL